MRGIRGWLAIPATIVFCTGALVAADDEGDRLGLGPAAAKVYGAEKGVSFGGYGEWVYQNFDSTLDDGTPSGETDNADFLRLVLYAGYKYSDKILFNSEIEYEHASTEDDGEVSVEFAYLDFLLRPSLNVRTGLVLVPVGWINEQHEPTTFLGVRRPLVERIVLPATWRELGAGVWGSAGPVTYRGFLTTSLDASGFTASEGIREGRQAGSKAAAEDLAISGRVDYTATPGLIAGVSFFHGDTGQGATVGGAGLDAPVTTLDAHVDWRWRALQVRALWSRVDVGDAAQVAALTGQTVGSRIEGAYVEAGYDVLAATKWNRHQLIPFARWETADTQAEVPSALAATVTGENDHDLLTVGVSYLPIPQIAIKADYQDGKNRAGTGLDQFNLGIGFVF